MTDGPVTHIVVVLDRSGSMDSVRDDAIGGFNSFVREQCNVEGAAKLTLVQFDSEWSVTWNALPLAEVPKLTPELYIPRGGTALYDAIGRAVGLAAESKARSGGAERVIVAILTDGQENQSRELDQHAVHALIQRRTAEGYTFLFLAANIDVERTATSIGIDRRHSTSFVQHQGGTGRAFKTMSQQVQDVRTGALPPLDTEQRKKLN